MVLHQFRLFGVILLSSFLFDSGAYAADAKLHVSQANKIPEATLTLSTSLDKWAGSYVSDGYAQRQNGYDWVSVSVKPLATQLRISIRSRADLKKPTCTFDGYANKVSDDLYQATVDGSKINFNFKDKQLLISTERDEDSSLLSYYCSGGASLKGSYQKTAEEIDQRQIDPRVFTKILNWDKGLGFDVSSTGQGSIQKLLIQPYGFKKDNHKVVLKVDGQVVNAEIGDLNHDGFPELMVYTQSAGSGSYGDVIAYSANKANSISRIVVPKITDDKKAKVGYMGHDEFAVLEGVLGRRFPIYKASDTNAHPTGLMRQIQYKMRNSEAGRQLYIDKIIEFAMP